MHPDHPHSTGDGGSEAHIAPASKPRRAGGLSFERFWQHLDKRVDHDIPHKPDFFIRNALLLQIHNPGIFRDQQAGLKVHPSPAG